MTFQKYLGDSKMFEYDKHYRNCQQLNKPFIKAKINPQHGNYFVQIDLMPCDYKFSKDDEEKLQNMINSENDFLESNSEPKLQGFSITSEFAWFDGVSTKNLDTFCNSLYDLTQDSKSN
ncbi:hypothetical protein AAA799E16_01237 [Marine Group I thaumarchaeote SCGC AAA799-E16]|uniref:Uncharacterized protein n=4 Tax=Marine Group I TaxID=905826 RepID=A0A087S7M9_9ARCH|nr:hypothetical protein AAA799N04_00930 [Marine Group I thaumarchaeote SCGC AAA799-N04]KER06060.1 hypothetical protein AAA799E16_01237 [Marine Group I thaumarchaeote SCGC AAA799-E16]KFM18158.1 hypothetical protein SCCGRSA3_01299 [Marine Group I thaumarchaeote SCGC RSA3]KFM21733.1 hypothetical protein AAA799B03_00682 [Marine Group I thaumarchaeote SCGC AAA799-B03]